MKMERKNTAAAKKESSTHHITRVKEKPNFLPYEKYGGKREGKKKKKKNSATQSNVIIIPDLSLFSVPSAPATDTGFRCVEDAYARRLRYRGYVVRCT